VHEEPVAQGTTEGGVLVFRKRALPATAALEPR